MFFNQSLFQPTYSEPVQSTVKQSNLGHKMRLKAAIYYFRRLYVSFDGYILLLALANCDFIRIQDFLAISRICGLKARLEFNINLLTLIQFCFFCSSVVTSINFNVPFWKCCFIRNTQMLKIWKFLHLTLQMVRKANKEANNAHELNP